MLLFDAFPSCNYTSTAPFTEQFLHSMSFFHKDIYLACDFNGQSGLHKSSRKDRLTNGSKVDALKDQDYVLTYDDKDVDWMLVSDLLEEHRGKEMRGSCLCLVS